MDTSRPDPACGIRCLAWSVVVLISPGSGLASEPVALRTESFTVSPATQPLVFVAIKNLRDAPYRGTVAMKAPKGWRVVPAARQVTLAPGEVKRVPFTVERGLTTEANAYPIEVSAVGAGATVVRQQNVVCASAPYFKPTIDGDAGEWKDAIPVTFMTGGKRTVISTYWNRWQFCLLVAVEEAKLVGYGRDGAFDALQVAVSPQEAKTGTSSDDAAARHEFLFVWSGSGTGAKCFRLAEPGMKLSEAAKSRRVAPLEFDQAKAAVSRAGGVTYYECAIPFRLMRRQIRPSEGREFRLSILVHDPDGTGIRDWGKAAGLWPWQRNPLAWCRWQGAKWGQTPPFDSKLEWGLCASKY